MIVIHAANFSLMSLLKVHYDAIFAYIPIVGKTVIIASVLLLWLYLFLWHGKNPGKNLPQDIPWTLFKITDSQK